MKTRRYIDSDEDIIVQEAAPQAPNPMYTMWLPLFLMVLVVLFGVWTFYPRNGMTIQNNTAVPTQDRPQNGTQYGIGGGPDTTSPSPTTYSLPSPTDTPKPSPTTMMEPSVSVSPTSILTP